jgi:hypothetical protein
VLRPPAHLRRPGEARLGLKNQAALFETGGGEDERVAEAQRRVEELEKKIAEHERGAALQIDAARRVQEFERELRKQKGIEASLREVVTEITGRSDETFRELKIMTEALKKEIARRKESDQLVAELREEMAAVRPDWSGAMEGEPSAAATAQSEGVEENFAWTASSSAAFVERLAALAGEQFSGAVVARHDGTEVRTYLEDGRVLAVVSNRPAERLGEALLRRMLVSEEQRDRALEIQQQTNIALGRVLLIMDAVSEEALTALMRERTEEETRHVLGWTELEFAEQRGLIPAHKLVPLRLEVDELIRSAHSSPQEVPTQPDETSVSVPVSTHDEGEPVEEKGVAENEDVAASLPAVAEEETPALEESPAAEINEPAAAFIGTRSKKSKKYHRPTCSALARVAESNRVPFATEQEALDAGYERCGTCLKSRKRAS